jgi:hypothetical protein
MATRVIVTGSRQLAGRSVVWDVLDKLTADCGPLLVVHGGCPNGADRFASEWCAMRGVGLVVYHAEWNRHGKLAGRIRNREMVADGADLVVAFPQDGAGNRGTRHCVEVAREAGLPVIVHGPEGWP